MKNTTEAQNERLNTIQRQNEIHSDNQRAMQIATETLQAASREIADNYDSLCNAPQVAQITDLSRHTIREDIKENRLKTIQRDIRNYIKKMT